MTLFYSSHDFLLIFRNNLVSMLYQLDAMLKCNKSYNVNTLITTTTQLA